MITTIIITISCLLILYCIYIKFYQWYYYREFIIRFNDNIDVLLFKEEEIVIDIFENDKKHKEKKTFEN